MGRPKRADILMAHPERGLFKLGLPITVGMLAQTLFNIVDTIFVGRLGADAIAAVTIVFPIAFIIIAIGSGIGVGTTSLVARTVGAKDRRAGLVVSNAIALSLLTSVFITITGLLANRFLFVSMGVGGEVLEMAVSYINIIFSGMVFMLFAMICSAILRGEGNAKTPMKVMITSAVLNIILDPVFIYVLGYGVSGAAIATVIARTVGSLIMFHVFFVKKSTDVPVSFKGFRFDAGIIKDIFRVGLPASFSQILMSSGMLILNFFLVPFGSVAVAAFGLGFRIDMLVQMPVIGISSGLVTMVGMFVGAKNFKRARWVTNYAMKVSIFIMSAVGILFFVIAEYLMMIFTSDAHVIALGAQYVRIVVLSYPFIAISMMVYSSFQGAGRGMPSLVLTFFRTILLSAPLAYIFAFVYGMGPVGVWVGIASSSFLSALAALIWYVCTHYEKCRTEHTAYPM